MLTNAVSKRGVYFFPEEFLIATHCYTLKCLAMHFILSTPACERQERVNAS